MANAVFSKAFPRIAANQRNAKTPDGKFLLRVLAIAVLVLNANLVNGEQISPARARAIAKEATIYGFPLVDSYRIQYSYFVDRSSAEFKAPWNILSNTSRVYTPEDKAIQTPNSDTPYSFLGADLRAEPLVLQCR